MDQQELQQNLMEFEKNRNQLMNIGAQKQQLQMQSAAADAALAELNKTSEKKAYKAVGNILVLCDVEDLKKELSEQKESTDLRIKTVQKQEDNLIEKLNKLRSKIETAAAELQGQRAPSSNSGEEPKMTPEKQSKGKK
ncbi:MAG: prefoldin subunit beta [Candidatus Diapherotrites archaeon]|nr:prefoldin subunit beta [Candidatus Diapherotrites archaeon]